MTITLFFTVIYLLHISYLLNYCQPIVSFYFSGLHLYLVYVYVFVYVYVLLINLSYLFIHYLYYTMNVFLYHFKYFKVLNDFLI